MFVHKKRDVDWGGRRYSTPKRHTVSFQDLPKGLEVARISATPRSTKLEDFADRPKLTVAETGLKRGGEAPGKSPIGKGTAVSPPSTVVSETDVLRGKLEAAQRTEQSLRLELQVVIYRQRYMRMVGEQKETIEGLRSELNRMKKHEESAVKVVPAQRYLTYTDTFDRDAARPVEGRLPEETVHPFKLHETPSKLPPKRDFVAEIESLE